MANREVAGRSVSWVSNIEDGRDRYDYVLQLRLCDQRFDRIIRIYM